MSASLFAAGAAVCSAMLAVCGASVGSAATAGPGAAPLDDPSIHPGQLVRLPDHRAINFRCTGSGAPTVLLEGGYGATSLAWWKVQPLVSPNHRVCAYDRAGFGFSDPGPLPRDGAAIARDLDQALRAARIGGPFIVVGHSAGGLYVRLFANLRPREVVGMVLVDPSVEYQDRRFVTAFGPGAGGVSALHARAERCLGAAKAGLLPSRDAALTTCTPAAKPGQSAAVAAARLAEAKRPTTWEAQLSELDTLWTLTSDEIAAGRQSYGGLPLIVLTADGTYAGAPLAVRSVVAAFWTGLHREVAARSSRGSERPVASSSHMMIFDRPDAIAAAIEEVTRDARTKGGTQ